MKIKLLGSLLRKPAGYEIEVFFSQKVFELDSIQTLELSNEEFNQFIHRPYKSYDFLSQYTNTYVDFDDLNSHALLLKTKGQRNGILVFMEGYNYARYVQIVEIAQ